MCNEKVLSDLGAGTLMLEAAFNSILLLTESNIAALDIKEREAFEDAKRKQEEEGKLSIKLLKDTFDEARKRIKT